MPIIGIIGENSSKCSHMFLAVAGICPGRLGIGCWAVNTQSKKRPDNFISSYIGQFFKSQRGKI